MYQMRYTRRLMIIFKNSLNHLFLFVIEFYIRSTFSGIIYGISELCSYVNLDKTKFCKVINGGRSYIEFSGDHLVRNLFFYHKSAQESGSGPVFLMLKNGKSFSRSLSVHSKTYGLSGKMPDLLFDRKHCF